MKKLVQVMQSVDSVPKLGRNAFHGYDYCREEDILRAVRGKLADLGILILTSVESATKTMIFSLKKVTAKNSAVTNLVSLA